VVKDSSVGVVFDPGGLALEIDEGQVVDAEQA